MPYERSTRMDTDAIKQAIDLVSFAVAQIGFTSKTTAFIAGSVIPAGEMSLISSNSLKTSVFVKPARFSPRRYPFFSERPSAKTSQPDTSRQAITAAPTEQTEAFFESAKKTVAATSRRLFGADHRGGDPKDFAQKRRLQD